MKKTLPKLKIEDDQLKIEGDFNFELSPTLVTDDLIPFKKVTFDWCVEISNAELITFGEDKIIETFAEKLKQDFIKFGIKNK